MHQQVMFTACPRDRFGDGLRLSVFVSPRLDPQGDDQLLGTFPDFLDWPATVAAIDWQVLLNGTPNAVQVTSDPPSSTLWTSLFSADTLVRPPEYPDYAAHLWFSYPAANLAGFVENLYQNIATDFPTEHPHVDDLAGTGIPALGHLLTNGRDKRPRLREQLLDFLRTNDRAAPPGPLDVEFDSFQLWNFHQPGNLAIGVEEPEFDFHEVVGFCSEHFGLLRRLGLVVDLIIPEPSVAAGGTTVQVLPTWTPQAGADHMDVRPITRALIQPDAFVAGPRPGAQEIVDGQLPLETAAYRAIQFDVDGAVLNLMTLARNLHQASLHTSLDTPEHEPVPRLRSGGISVVRTGQSQALVTRVDTGAELHAAREAGDDVVLYAEDLWRGTRWDVLDDSGQWHSLQYREGDYEFITAPATESISEEGVVIETPSSRDEDGGDEEYFYQGESLMSWEGWSLAAPRPGRTLNSQDQVVDAPDDPPDGFPLVMNFAATPGTLPRLRFARQYRLRARTVDVAGNSLPPESTDTSHATDRITYGRHEPVPAPYVLGRLFNGQGESVEHVVLRSNFDIAPPVDAERHIAPPRTAQRPAEEHGMYDTAAGVDPNAYAAIVAREAESFADPSYAGGISQPDPNHADQPVFPNVPLPILYLPDPIARGVSFHREVDDEILLSFDTGDVWPNAQPVRLVVTEGAGDVTVVEAEGERVLTVGLPKAERLEVPFSCYLDADDLDQMAIWRLMITSGAANAAQVQEWRGLAERGRLWMMTPHRTLTLVHAVRQPLEPAEFTNDGTPGRAPASTLALVSAAMTFSRKSTSRIDWRGQWTDPIDRGPGGGAAAPDPFDKDNERWLEVPLTGSDSQDEDFLPVTVRHEFGDTKRHIVTYRSRATTAFQEYFDAADFPGEDTPFSRDSSEDIVVDIPSSARPAAPKVLYVVPTHEWTSGGGGLSLSSEGKGGGLRVYLDRPWFGSGVGQLLGVVLAPNPGNISDALSSYVTRWGFDPIQSSIDLPGPAPLPQHFPIAAEVGAGVLAENGTAVDVVGHEVGFDTDRQLWYCDIQLDAGDADWPFVRLALAGFQPNSVFGLHISPVVLAEFIQLTPDRSASIGLAGGPGSREMQLSFVAPLPGGDGSTEVVARLERQLPDFDDELLGWEQVAGAQTDTELAPATTPRGPATWTGTLRLPPRNRPGHDRLRVVIEQFLVTGRVPAGATTSAVGSQASAGRGSAGSGALPDRDELASSTRDAIEERARDAILGNLSRIPGVGRRDGDQDDSVGRRLIFQDIINVSSLRQPGLGR